MVNSTASALASPARQTSAVNPFARALADTEREKQYSDSPTPQSDNNLDLFREALAKGGAQGSAATSKDMFDQERYLAEQQEQQKREALRKKLHDQVNPVDTFDVFSAREQQVKQEIDGLRHELSLLVNEVAAFNQDVELTLMTEVSHPGESGTYYLSFFQQLRTFIFTLRQKIRSASTWATQMHSKNAKKKAKQGMVIGGLGHEKTSTIQDMMHHERSSQYSGG